MEILLPTSMQSERQSNLIYPRAQLRVTFVHNRCKPLIETVPLIILRIMNSLICLAKTCPRPRVFFPKRHSFPLWISERLDGRQFNFLIRKLTIQSRTSTTRAYLTLLVNSYRQLGYPGLCTVYPNMKWYVIVLGCCLFRSVFLSMNNKTDMYNSLLWMKTDNSFLAK